MNKRLKAAVIIAASVLLIGIAAVVTTCIIADRIIFETEKLRSQPATPETLEQYHAMWEKYERILSCYTRHSEVENIGSSVEIIDILWSSDKNLFEIECDRILSAAEHLRRTEIPHLSNIL